MTKLASLFIAVSLAMTASVAASAEDRNTATLRIDRGSAMTSTGGEFVTAQNGQVVTEGDRLMVPENSKSTVIFSETCEREYTAPGVYTIDDCDKVAALATGFDAVGAATVVAGSLGVAAILYNMDQVAAPEPAPVSR